MATDQAEESLQKLAKEYNLPIDAIRLKRPDVAINQAPKTYEQLAQEMPLNDTFTYYPESQTEKTLTALVWIIIILLCITIVYFAFKLIRRPKKQTKPKEKSLIALMLERKRLEEIERIKELSAKKD
ncbi:hypothetical protein [Methylomonas sp. 11b]|uniref:hypothetical protein n=1 Tax=Methylomonas sp. 11b TaxID=1168169 RepID=UPI00047D81F9|nr:hypothetical protein [Methylomonas sp. 11b]